MGAKDTNNDFEIKGSEANDQWVTSDCFITYGPFKSLEDMYADMAIRMESEDSEDA